MAIASPDAPREINFKYAQGSSKVLVPVTPMVPFYWNILFSDGPKPAFLFSAWDLRVTEDENNPPFVSVYFEGQTSFPSAGYAGYPTAQLYIHSKAGDLIEPAPLKMMANLYGHQAHIPFNFHFGPLQNYKLNQVGYFRLEGLDCHADLQ